MRKVSDIQTTSDLFFSRIARRGLMYRAAEDDTLTGRTFTLDGRELRQFGSGSYMGLETDPRLKAGAIDAVQRYGTQFPSSRAYVSAPLYPEAEALLERIIGTPVLLTASSTLAHTAAIPVLVDEADAVLVDQQAHTTLQMALHHVRILGVPVELIRHNRLDMLEARLTELARQHNRVWFMADGIYSMFGDRAPMAALKALLDRHEALHLYLDDAHGMSWTGRHGRGHVLEHLPTHPRLVVATSLAKSFASGGGLLVLPDAEWRRKVRTIGPSLVFSGPLQPANLGALIASAQIHLSDELADRQAALLERIRHCNRRCRELGLPLVSFDEVPIRFVATGLSAVAGELGQRLLEDGFFANVAVFPAVPMQRAGLRFTLTLHQTLEDLDAFLLALAHHLPRELERAGSSVDAVFETFRLQRPDAPAPTERVLVVPPPALTLQHESSIAAFSPAEWDGWLGDRGAFSWEGLRVLEGLYRNQPRPEDHWRFHYYVVRDAAGKPVLATFFTEALWKDDMLAPESVSAELEAQRTREPDWLVSRTFAMGSLLTEGDHLYLDRNADWRGAMDLLLRAARHEQALCGATRLVLRDVAAEDTDMDDYLLAQGFARSAMPETLVQPLDWADEADWLAGLSQKSRRHLKREVFPWDEAYDETIWNHRTGLPPADELARCHELYLAVKARNLRFNTFALPPDVFTHLLGSPAWELLVLRRRGEPEGPIAGCAAAYVGSDHYVPLLVGMDYNLVTTHGLYRQLLRRLVRRARALGASRVHHGFGAALEKSRFGARVRQAHAYFEATDLYQMELLGHMMMKPIKR